MIYIYIPFLYFFHFLFVISNFDFEMNIYFKNLTLSLLLSEVINGISNLILTLEDSTFHYNIYTSGMLVRLPH